MSDPTVESWFVSNWKWIVAVVSVGLVAPVFHYLKARITGTAEAIHITESSKMETLKMSDALLREWMATASRAEKRIGVLENCLWELLPIVEQVDIPGARRAVAKVRHILNVSDYEDTERGA